MGKLVRDRVPEMVRDAGGNITVRRLDDDEYAYALRKKLVEEASEVAAAHEGDALLDELADVAEVLYELVRVAGLTPAALHARMAEKAQTHGRFERRLSSTAYRSSSETSASGCAGVPAAPARHPSQR